MQFSEQWLRQHVNPDLDSKALGHVLTMAEYDGLLDQADSAGFGVRDLDVSHERYVGLYDEQFKGRGLLALRRISNYHREYEWS